MFSKHNLLFAFAAGAVFGVSLAVAGCWLMVDEHAPEIVDLDEGLNKRKEMQNKAKIDYEL